MSSSRSTLSRVAESGRSGSKRRAEAPGRARPSGESVPGPWGRLYAYSGERVRHPANCARQRRVRGLEGSDCHTQLLDDRLGLRAPLLLRSSGSSMSPSTLRSSSRDRSSIVSARWSSVWSCSSIWRRCFSRMPAMLPGAARTGRGGFIGGLRCAEPTLDEKADEQQRDGWTDEHRGDVERPVEAAAPQGDGDQQPGVSAAFPLQEWCSASSALSASALVLCTVPSG
jgi:hypothetical protein